MNRMKRTAAVCALLLVPCAALAQDAKPADATQDAPRLQMDETEWDFGSVWYNTPLEHEVILKNVGSAPLKIERVKTSCGCTAAKPTEDEIAPGGSVSMAVKYDSTRPKKQVSTTVTITSNDPTRPSVIYRLRGEIKPCYELNPASGAAFGQMMRESQETRKVEIVNLYDEKMFLKLEEFKDPAYEVTLNEVEPGMRYELIAKTLPPLKSGNSRLDAILTSSLDRIPQVKVPVRGYIVPLVSVTPATLYVPKVYRKRSEKVLNVRYMSGHPVDIVKVTCDHPGVEATIMPPTEAGALGYTTRTIRVSLPPGAEIPDEEPTLTIHTNAEDPEFAELKVKITNGVRQRAAGRTVGPAGVQTTPVRRANVAGADDHAGHDHGDDKDDESGSETKEP